MSQWKHLEGQAVVKENKFFKSNRKTEIPQKVC